MAIPLFEEETTIQFTWTSSVAPDAAPLFSVVDGLTSTVISSFTSTQSDTTHFYALYTMPNSTGYFIGTWTAAKTISSSARNFVNRFVFKVSETSAI